MATKDFLEIDYMDGHEFEYYCANILRKNGYSNVEVTRGSGDYGIDILAHKDEKSYAIQAGREIRIMVVPEQVSDDEMVLMARNVAKKIEDELEYPGQIKVSLIRESRVFDYAK